VKTYGLIFLFALVLCSCNGTEPDKAEPDKAEPAPSRPQFDYTFEAQGKKFRTYISSIYGANDIWLEYSTDGKNYTRVFTGCALQPDAWSDAYTAAYADGKIIISYERAISMGGDSEHTRFVAFLAEIERDSDKDGLPDLVEYRFRTHAGITDTDGDGKKDSEDANPLASGKIKLTEHQEIWKAAFLQYRAEHKDLMQLRADGIVLSVFESESDFFELPGREDPVLAMTVEQVERFIKDFGVKVSQVCFREISQLSPEEGRRRVAFELDVVLGKLVGRGYRLTLEEQDGEWKLIDVTLEWMS
jgi:hypothetical protein